MSERRPLIEVKGVSLSLGKTPVLVDVSLTVREGDFLALIGPNGSGKTTLIRVMLGLARPDAGKVRLLGEDAASFSRWDQVGYIPQKSVVTDPHFPASVREVTAMGILPLKRFPRFLGPADAKAIREALALVGMEGSADRRVGDLSGGQQQRVFIARALVSHPSLLILDEPTAGVDTATQASFYDLLDHLNREKGITLVLVTHDIGVVTRHVRQVACLNQTLVFHGSHDDFCASPQLASMFGPDAHIICHDH